MVGLRRKEIGLGGFPEVPLAEAVRRAREAKERVRHGIDPVEERKAAGAALKMRQGRALTFANAVDRYLAAKLVEFKNEKHRAQWRMTLAAYAGPELGQLLVAEVAVQDVLRVLEPLWRTKTETASRLRGRIEAILAWATVAGYRSGDNPARWAGNLKEMLPAPAKLKGAANQPAIQLADAVRWFAALRGRDGIGSRALEFLVLTACRSGEVRGALWEEIDINKQLWIVPALRMKMNREHRVPLSAEAVLLLQALPRLEGSPLVFPAMRGGQLSDMTLSAAMKRIHEAEVKLGGVGFLDRVSKRPAVPHGVRSTFRDWAAETTHFPGEMAEAALAHRVGSSVEAAYRRGDMMEKRRQMMAAWAGFLVGRVA
jgi:integrase